MPKIQLSQRMYSIRDIDRLLETKELLIQPKYQRRRSPWPLKAKSGLIDTIFNNYPIPPIYLRDFVGQDGKRNKEIIDGQQRISTIVEFFNNEFKLTRNISNPEFVGCQYSELPEDEKILFEDFEVSFLAIRGALDSDIISIFSRLNSFSLPLNSQEKRNALFVGEIKALIYELSSEFYTFWTMYRILSDNQIARMQDALLVSEIISTILNGFSSSSSPSLDRMYAHFEDNLEEREKLYNNFNKTMTILGNLFASDQIQKVFKPKFMFYTLFICVYSKIYGIHGIDKTLSKIRPLQIMKNLEDFSIKFLSPSFDPEIKERLKKATGNIGSRQLRHTTVSDLIV